MREDHFSSTLLQLDDILADFEEEGRDTRLVKHFKMALAVGKQGVKFKPGFCTVNIPRDK